MARLIDADALIEKYAGWVNIYSPKPGGRESFRVVTTQEIGYMPTIDAIPVEWIKARWKNWCWDSERCQCERFLIEDWQKEQEVR